MLSLIQLVSNNVKRNLIGSIFQEMFSLLMRL